MTDTSAVDQKVCRYPACQSSAGCQGVCSKSIVRSNLLTERFYTPYCGSVEKCSHGMPRTRFDGEQFACRCGWRSGFEAQFIERYKAAQASMSATLSA